LVLPALDGRQDERKLDDAGQSMKVEPIWMERDPVRPASCEARIVDAALERAAADFAARAAALADLLRRWRRPADARAVITTLLAGDGTAFRELLTDFDPPLPGKCRWLCGVIESIIGGDVEFRTVCRLRTDLTAGERWLCLQLVQQFQPDELPVGDPRDGPRAARGAAIAAGPFLDALRAEGLVTCTEEPVQGVALPPTLARLVHTCV
jgi:hypothetical protein